MFYEMTIAGCKRQLPLCRLNDELMIGAFVILGDQELTVACAKALLEISPDYDYLISAEVAHYNEWYNSLVKDSMSFLDKIISFFKSLFNK